MIVLGYSGFTRGARGADGRWRHLGKTGIGFDALFEHRQGDAPLVRFPLGFFGHDSAAAVVVDGAVVACAAEERFSRTKHALNLVGNTLLPTRATEYCLRAAGVGIEDVDVVAHYCDFTTSSVSERLASMGSALTPTELAPLARAYDDVYAEMLRGDLVEQQFASMAGGRARKFVHVGHHFAHAASAFYQSGFPEALVLTLDGAGETESSLVALGEGRRLVELERTCLPTSLGALYLAFSVYLGFKSLGDEYKVMGLAGYGRAHRFRAFFESIVPLTEGGRYCTCSLSRPGFREAVLTRLGPAREPDQLLDERHADIAAALQETLERAVLHTLRHHRLRTKMRRLAMAGGVALNCSLNGAIARSRLFDEIFVQPAAGDDGCSLGAALHAWAALAPSSQEAVPVSSPYLGPSFRDSDVVAALEERRAELRWTREPRIEARIAQELATGRVAGWFQGRMEFGPRALGNRSILADPRDAQARQRLNEKVKRRESFRPFAPAVLGSDAESFFDMSGVGKSPYMLFAVPVHRHARSLIPAVTHTNGTARVQTVTPGLNPRFWSVIDAFREITGVPVLLNTSFNVRSEPIVCSPRDAVACFLGTGIDCLGIHDFFVEKSDAAQG
jgi:carbamoyltransferase